MIIFKLNLRFWFYFLSKYGANVHVGYFSLNRWFLQVQFHCYYFVYFSHLLDVDVGLDSMSYMVAENFGEVVVCVAIHKVNSSCAIEFPFSVYLSTTDGSAGIKILLSEIQLFHYNMLTLV